MALNGYTKLSSSIIGSTVWRESSDTRVVWITMLALAGADGVVEASVPGLADLARVPIQACEEALQTFQSADPYSRTEDHDGRRIEPVKGGWLILNHASYRERENKDARREYLRVKKQESRARLSTPIVDSQQNRVDVNAVNDGQPDSTQAEAEAEAEAESSSSKKTDGAGAPDGRRKGERRKTHAGHVPGFCDWVCFPKRLQQQFAAQSGEDVRTPELRAEVEDRVRAWALDVRTSWEGKPIGDSMWNFWSGRWREFIGSSTTPQPRGFQPRIYRNENR